MTKYEEAHILSTLAAGYAEMGDFTSAVHWSEEAVAVGRASQKEQLAKELQSYHDKKPWREEIPPEFGFDEHEELEVASKPDAPAAKPATDSGDAADDTDASDKPAAAAGAGDDASGQSDESDGNLPPTGDKPRSKLPRQTSESRRGLLAGLPVHPERQLAQAHAGRRGSHAGVRPTSSAPTKRLGASSACCTISTTSAGPIRPHHPLKGPKSSPGCGYPAEVIYAIKSHADYLTDCPRISPLDKTLYACDELAGFITAVARLRPEGIRGLQAGSVKKKLKQRALPPRSIATTSTAGPADLGVELDEHIQNVIDAMTSVAADLGLEGSGSPPQAG